MKDRSDGGNARDKGVPALEGSRPKAGHPKPERQRRGVKIPAVGKMGGIYGGPDPMGSMFAKYGVPYGDHQMLNWALLEKYESGFRATKTGRPRELGAHLFERLVDALAKSDGLAKVSDRVLAKMISKKVPEAPKWETLRKHLPRARAFAKGRRSRTRLITAWMQAQQRMKDSG